MIEPRAMGLEALARDGKTAPVAWFGQYPKDGEKLYTLADVLDALREPSDAMMDAGRDAITNDWPTKDIFLAMLDQFEKEQSGNASINAAKRRYEAANPLGGPARMFDAIAERIRSGEDYHSVLADYGVTVEAK